MNECQSVGLICSSQMPGTDAENVTGTFFSSLAFLQPPPSALHLIPCGKPSPGTEFNGIVWETMPPPGSPQTGDPCNLHRPTGHLPARFPRADTHANVHTYTRTHIPNLSESCSSFFLPGYCGHKPDVISFSIPAGPK